MRRITLTVALCAAFVSVPGATSTGRDHDTGPAIDPSRVVATSWDHRYRVDGRLWVLMYWASRNDVGIARMSRQDNGDGVVVSFLAGSNPDRAPLSVNQWGYTRETSDAGGGRAFVIRTLDPRDPAEPEAHLAATREPSLFGASCGTVDGDSTDATVTGFRVEPKVTVRSMDQALDVARTARRWRMLRTPTSGIVYPGLFSALQAALDESVARYRAGASDLRVAPRTYSYRSELFDLSTRKMEPTAGGLLRGSFTYAKQMTGEHGNFTVTVGTDGERAGVPVEMVFQPAWWVRVSLHLDDSLDLPDGHAQDDALATRIDDICTRALRPESSSQ